MPAPTISYQNTTTATKFGGDALNNVNNYLNGVNVTAAIGTPIIRTPTKIPSDILMFTDPAEDNTVTVKVPALSANKNINLIPADVQDNDVVLYKDSVQTVSGKVISAGTNTITGLTNSNLSGSAGITDANLAQITSKSKQHAQTAYLDNQNNFSTTQLVTVDSTAPLTLVRPTSSTSAIVSWRAQMRDSASNNTDYARIDYRIGTNTDTSETGFMDFWTMKNGTLSQYMVLDGNQLSLGVSGSRVIMDASSISGGSKTITWANLTGTPVLTTGSQSVSSKTISSSTVSGSTITSSTIDWSLNTGLRQSRYGVYTPDSSSGRGVLDGLSILGVDGGNTVNTGGKYKILNTRAVADDAAGIVKLDSFTCWRNSQPLLRFAFLFVSGGSRRVFKGLGQKRLVTVTSNTEPLNSGEAGFLFGYASGDTEFQVFHNDASGTCQKTTTGISIPGANTNYIVEISGTDSGGGSFTWALYSVSSGTRGSLVGTATLTSEIPASTTALYLQDVVATTDATIRPNNIHYVEVFV